MFKQAIYTFILLLIIAGVPCYAQEISEKNTSDIVCGAERMDMYLPLLKGKNIALLINQTSRVGNTLLFDTLLSKRVHIVKIFVPEHGLRGQANAGADINNGKDSATGIAIVSLYGKNQKPTKEQLDDVDVVVYDLQDVGIRFYTYISTLQYIMEACAEQHKKLVVLDRPNPNGFYVDGPVLDTSLRSFVGMQPIPVVYGMTCGEFVKMLVGEQWLKNAGRLDMDVVTCKNYDHKKKYDLLYAPSPNLKTMAAVYLYPSLCFFEGTAISVGRGTDKPFQQWGCPENEGKSNYYFIPNSMTGAQKPLYEGENCYGQLIARNKKEALIATGGQLRLNWLLKAYEWYPDKGKFFNAFFDKLSGDRELKKQIQNGVSEKDIKISWQPGLIAFKKIRKKYLLYADFE